MKSIFFVTILLTFSANAQSEKLRAISDAKKILINGANHFCYLKNGKKQTLVNSKFVNTKKACEHAGMFASLSDIENKSSCEEVVDRFLEKRGLGTIGKPSTKVGKSVFNKDQVTKLPEINLKTQDGETVSSKANEKESVTNWSLTVESGWQIPMFESALMAISEINKGSYSRTYNFELMGGVCVLRSIDSSFLPEGKKEATRKSESLSQFDCQSISQTYLSEQGRVDLGQNSKISAENALKGYVCSESIALFNGPRNVKERIFHKREKGDR